MNFITRSIKITRAIVTLLMLVLLISICYNNYHLETGLFWYFISLCVLIVGLHAVHIISKKKSLHRWNLHMLSGVLAFGTVGWEFSNTQPVGMEFVAWSAFAALLGLWLVELPINKQALKLKYYQWKAVRIYNLKNWLGDQYIGTMRKVLEEKRNKNDYSVQIGDQSFEAKSVVFEGEIYK